jgi:hypothetical protein
MGRSAITKYLLHWFVRRKKSQIQIKTLPQTKSLDKKTKKEMKSSPSKTRHTLWIVLGNKIANLTQNVGFGTFCFSPLPCGRFTASNQHFFESSVGWL